MQFKPGKSGNPSGRPKGSRNTQTQLLKLLEPYAEKLINKMVEEALDGNAAALRLCIERLLPKAQRKAWKLIQQYLTKRRSYPQQRFSP